MSKKVWHIISIAGTVIGAVAGIVGGIAGGKETELQIKEDVQSAIEEQNKISEE